MDAFTTHGAFSWSELMTNDAKAATEFYGTLFGWTIEPMPMAEGNYHVVKVGGEAVGGIRAIPPTAGPLPPAWARYVAVPGNIQQRLASKFQLHDEDE